MKGFTLIEVVVYIALYAIIIGGAVEAAYGLARSGQNDSARADGASETAFVAAKLQWALADPSAFPEVSGSGCAQEIRIVKTGYGKNPIDIRLKGETLEMSEGGGVFEPLTTGRVKAACLTFDVLPSAPPAAGIRAEATLGGNLVIADGYVGR